MMKQGQTKKPTTKSKITAKRTTAGGGVTPARNEEKKTMKMINGLAHVSYIDLQTFYDELRRNVNEMQEKGMEVEIQYGCTPNRFTALLIGRKEKEV